MTGESSLSVRLPLVAAAAAALFSLTGCSMQSGMQAASVTQGVALSGTIMGGRQPIAGSKVYMFAAGTGGYGSASTSLLSGTGTLTDSNGAYVTSDANGNFSITGDYLCTAGTQVYLYASGGTASPGDGNNTSIGLLAGLGQCPSSGTFLSTTPTININEVTTIATAFSLAGYAINPTHIGSANTTMATTGIANAMGNVANVVDISHGVALTQPASTSGQTGNNANAAAPYNKINALADVLAACINGASNNASCQTIFNNITSNGNTTTGNNPTDTATAAIYMAKNQWNAGAGFTNPTTMAVTPSIFSLITSSSPFATTLTSATDLSLAVTYYGQGTGGAGLAADAMGNLWASVNGNSTLTKFSPQGAYGTPTFIYGSTNGTLISPGTVSPGPQNLAIDSTGNVWVGTVNAYTTKGGMQYYVYNSSDTQIANSPYYPTTGGVAALAGPYGIAFDTSGNAYSANLTGNNVVELSSSGTYEATLSSTATTTADGVAIAKNGDIWVGSTNATTPLYYFPLASSSGQVPIAIPNCQNTTTAVAQIGQGLSIDASNNAWFSCTLAGTATTTGVAKVTPAGLVTEYFTASHGGGTLAIDSSGNVFQGCGKTGGCVNEFNSSGTMLTPAGGYNITPSTTGTASNELYIAIDISGNLWATGPNRVYQLLGVAAPTAGPILPSNIQALP